MAGRCAIRVMYVYTCSHNATQLSADIFRADANRDDDRNLDTDNIRRLLERACCIAYSSCAFPTLSICLSVRGLRLNPLLPLSLFLPPAPLSPIPTHSRAPEAPKQKAF